MSLSRKRQCSVWLPHISLLVPTLIPVPFSHPGRVLCPGQPQPQHSPIPRQPPAAPPAPPSHQHTSPHSPPSSVPPAGTPLPQGAGAGTARTHPALGSVPLKSKGGGTGGQQSSLVARWEHLQGVWAFPPAPRCSHAPWPPTQGPLPSPLPSLPKAEAQEDPKAFGIPRRTFPSSSYAPPWARALSRSRPTQFPAEHLPPLHPCAALSLIHISEPTRPY